MIYLQNIYFTQTPQSLHQRLGSKGVREGEAGTTNGIIIKTGVFASSWLLRFTRNLGTRAFFFAYFLKNNHMLPREMGERRHVPDGMAGHLLEDLFLGHLVNCEDGNLVV